ncbi:hypothetical protein JW926_04245 [Candidatus Sumerlaeota bacterium]|nr:hypothetical protein [Candidatus Sumerlaeota bacterium]
MQKTLIVSGILFLIMASSFSQEMKPMKGEDLIIVEREIEGASEKEAMEEAVREAVQSCVGRAYFSDNLIMARSLLIKYIDQYYEKFIYSRVVESKTQSGDKIRLKLKIFVDYSRLLKDLDEKGFLFTPRIRPYFLVFLSEVLDEAPATYNHGREAVRSAWKDITGQRDPENEILIPPPNMDVTESEPFLEEAIRVAQKNGVELIISGTSSSERDERKEFYYETYTFYRTTVHLKMIRVDNGKVMGETTVSSLAASERENQAIQLSITRAARKAASELADAFNANWEHSVLNKGDYIFMFSGVNDEKIELINKHLSALDPNARVFIRSRYADVAVVNFLYKGNHEKLIFTLERLSYPRMHIIRQEGNRFEIQIKN